MYVGCVRGTVCTYMGRPHGRPSPIHPYTYDFNLFALIIHNSINANKLTLSKSPAEKGPRSFYGFRWAPFMAADNNPVIIWGLESRKTYQLRSRGINLSDFYVNSIHFIYSVKSYVCSQGYENGNGNGAGDRGQGTGDTESRNLGRIGIHRNRI